MLHFYFVETDGLSVSTGDDEPCISGDCCNRDMHPVETDGLSVSETHRPCVSTRVANLLFD